MLMTLVVVQIYRQNLLLVITVVVKIQHSFPVICGRSTVAAVMRRLIIPAIGLYQYVAVNKGLAVLGSVSYLHAVFAVNKVKIAVAALDPVVTDDQAGGAIFQIDAAGTAALSVIRQFRTVMFSPFST